MPTSDAPMPVRPAVAAAAAVAVLLSGCAGGGATTSAPDAVRATIAAPEPSPTPSVPPPVEDPGGTQRVLDEVAAAFASADPDALREHLHDPDSTFGRGWLERAENLAQVPLSRYRLELDPSLPDLATDRVRGAYTEPVQVLYVTEEHALEGYDTAGPATSDLFLTMVRDGETWKVAADSDAEALGLTSVRHLWDTGPVVTSGDGAVLALHHPDDDEVETVVAEAERAIAQARERWPRDWPGTVALIVPRDAEELGTLLNVTFELTNFIAFATATSTGELGEVELTGSRVVVNPDRFFLRDTDIRQRILVHELVHVASRPSTGPAVPSWLEEGVAQALGERRSTTGTDLLDVLLSGGFQGTLPTDGQFTTGGQDGIFLAYQLSWSFVDHLVDQYGADAVGRFYVSAGRGSVAEPGVSSHHLDRAAEEIFDVPFDELRADWAAATSG